MIKDQKVPKSIELEQDLSYNSLMLETTENLCEIHEKLRSDYERIRELPECEVYLAQLEASLTLSTEAMEAFRYLVDSVYPGKESLNA